MGTFSVRHLDLFYGDFQALKIFRFNYQKDRLLP